MLKPRLHVIKRNIRAKLASSKLLARSALNIAIQMVN